MIGHSAGAVRREGVVGGIAKRDNHAGEERARQSEVSINTAMVTTQRHCRDAFKLCDSLTVSLSFTLTRGSLRMASTTVTWPLAAARRRGAPHCRVSREGDGDD